MTDGTCLASTESRQSTESGFHEEDSGIQYCSNLLDCVIDTHPHSVNDTLRPVSKEMRSNVKRNILTNTASNEVDFCQPKEINASFPGMSNAQNVIISKEYIDSGHREESEDSGNGLSKQLTSSLRPKKKKKSLNKKLSSVEKTVADNIQLLQTTKVTSDFGNLSFIDEIKAEKLMTKLSSIMPDAYFLFDKVSIISI